MKSWRDVMPFFGRRGKYDPGGLGKNKDLRRVAAKENTSKTKIARLD